MQSVTENEDSNYTPPDWVMKTLMVILLGLVAFLAGAFIWIVIILIQALKMAFGV